MLALLLPTEQWKQQMQVFADLRASRDAFDRAKDTTPNPEPTTQDDRGNDLTHFSAYDAALEGVALAGHHQEIMTALQTVIGDTDHNASE